MNRFEEILNDVKEILKKSPIDFELQHAELVLKWVLKLKPDADEALKIAAVSHDIDRGVTGILEKHLADYSQIDEYKRQHALRSSKFITEILEKHAYPADTIAKVKTLVENHEVGGNYEADILKDADSIAYFEFNIPGYMKINGEERTKEKIKFMYKRMSSNAKKIVRTLKYKDITIDNLVKATIE